MCFLMPMKLVFVKLHGRDSKELLLRISRCACLYLFISVMINRKIHYLAVFLFPYYTLRMQKVINGSMRKFPSLDRKDKSRKLCLLSASPRCRAVQSLQITGVKRNVLFLQRARMQKLINGSMRNVSLSGERGGMTTIACRHWL